MAKVTFLSAALIAAVVFTTQAMAARGDVLARSSATKAHTGVADCARAPNVGAFASAPPVHA